MSRVSAEESRSVFAMNLDDLDYTLFDALGGRGKMVQLFGDQMHKMMDELNEKLAA